MVILVYLACYKCYNYNNIYNKSMKCQSIIRDISSNVIIWKFICLLMNPVSKLIILKCKLCTQSDK